MGSQEPTTSSKHGRQRRVAARVWRALTAEIPPRSDHTRARVGVLQQLMLTAAVVIVAIFAFFAGVPGDLALFSVGALILLMMTVVTFLVPWNSISPWVIAIVPLVDILAVLLIRVAYPQSGLALLWLFPVMWLSASGGLIGYIGSNVIVWTAYLWILAAEGAPVFAFSAVIVPIVMLSVSSGAYFSVRRVSAQRMLLDKQTAVLAQTLERSQHQEQLVTQVLDSVDFGVIRIAKDGAVTVTNEAHGRMQKALVGADGHSELPAYDFDGRTLLARDEMPLARALRGEVFDNQIVWFGAPDAPRRALSVSSRRLRDTHGSDAGVVIISRDVTAERIALRARDNVVASVSHELRAPLTAIVGYLDLALESEGIPAKVRDDLAVVTDNAERMIQIISDILSASSASGSSVDVTISTQDADLQRLVLEAAQAWAPSATERRITLFTDDVRPARAYFDPSRMRQVVDNLISNAIKYGREGGSVELAVYGDETASWVLVRDDGIGITPDDQKRLFHRFFRATSDVGGTGLGLAISRDIVRAHGGEIIVGSEPGVGSAFLVRIPARVDQPLPPVDPEVALQMSGAITTATLTERGGVG